MKLVLAACMVIVALTINSASGCGDHQFQCASGECKRDEGCDGSCLPLAWKCDAIVDCADESDEEPSLCDDQPHSQEYCMEQDVGYKVGENDVQASTEADWQSCKSHCSENYPTFEYFMHNAEDMSCWCMMSREGEARRPHGRKRDVGTVSGWLSEECEDIGKVDCPVEFDTSIYGNNLNGVDDYQPDWQSCRSFCASNYPSATWFQHEFNENDVSQQNRCRCKTSDEGRAANPGDTSGMIDCQDIGAKEDNSCGPNFTPVGNNCLYAGDEKMNYDQAKQICLDMGSNVVEFKNEQELSEITSWMNSKSFWIGLIDENNEGNFIWESGQMLASDVESYWGPNQPANSVEAGQRVCTHVNAEGIMDDVNCETLKHHVVCQENAYGAEHVPEAEPTEECISQSEVVPTGDLCCPGDACADNGICLTRCCSPWNAMPDNTAECNESGWTKTCKEGFEYVKGIGCTTP